jgi:8-oxo-dGTP diphosphatase
VPVRSPSARKSARVVTLTVDVVLFTPQGSELAVLVAPAIAGRVRPRERGLLPSGAPRGDEALDDTATRIAQETLGSAPSFLDQAAASTSTGGVRTSVERTDVTVTYFGLAPDAGGTPQQGAEWIATSDLLGLSTRQSAEVEVALTAMRARVDQQPIAFRLLPPTFTLSELQSVYELLLGRRLHKASFRRSLHASALVEATDEWRSEGRGRPAQLFRYAPPRRRRQRRGIRFDLLS